MDGLALGAPKQVFWLLQDSGLQVSSASGSTRSHQSLLCRHVVNIPTRGVEHDDIKIDYRHDTYDTSL